MARPLFLQEQTSTDHFAMSPKGQQRRKGGHRPISPVGQSQKSGSASD